MLLKKEVKTQLNSFALFLLTFFETRKRENVRTGKKLVTWKYFPFDIRWYSAWKRYSCRMEFILPESISDAVHFVPFKREHILWAFSGICIFLLIQSVFLTKSFFHHVLCLFMPISFSCKRQQCALIVTRRSILYRCKHKNKSAWDLTNSIQLLLKYDVLVHYGPDASKDKNAHNYMMLPL